MRGPAAPPHQGIYRVPPGGISNSLRGGGMDIFWNHTKLVRFLLLQFPHISIFAICKVDEIGSDYTEGVHRGSGASGFCENKGLGGVLSLAGSGNLTRRL